MGTRAHSMGHGSPRTSSDELLDYARITARAEFSSIACGDGFLLGL